MHTRCSLRAFTRISVAVQAAPRSRPIRPLRRLLATTTSSSATTTQELWAAAVERIYQATGITVGSRTPLPGTPAWATLQVLTGGFASGSLPAGGELLPFELDAMQRLGLPLRHLPPCGGPAWPSLHGDAPMQAMPDRTQLNCHYLTGAGGLEELQARLASGCYRMEVPEEGALLAVAWLVGRGMQAEACELLEHIVPWFDRLRFYPRPADSPVSLSGGEDDVVHVWSVDQALTALRAASERRPASLAAQERAHGAWRPLMDELVDLWLETVEGPAPTLVLDAKGRPVRTALGGTWLTGGWPCQVYPDGWAEHAATLLRRTAGAGPLPTGRKHRLTRTLGLLRRVAERGPGSLSGRDVASLRETLACALARRGAPGSERRTSLAAADAAAAEACGRGRRAAAELLGRLQPYAGDGGCPAPRSGVLAPVDGGRRQLPPSLACKALRCLDAPLGQQLDEGTVASAEALAVVLPQLTSQVAAAAAALQPVVAEGGESGVGTDDTGAAHRGRSAAPGDVTVAVSAEAEQQLRSAGALLAALYSAFRRRRSLLLLNLESQVRLHELPWVAALARGAAAAGGRPEAPAAPALALLRRVAALTLRHFPATLLPNKLLQELGALAAAAGVPRERLPLVDELASDIFMGTFGPKFLRSARLAAGLLRGSLYARYYGIDYDEVLALKEQPKEAGRGGGVYGWYGGYRSRREEDAFAALCGRRAAAAGDPKGGMGPVARNGRVIEQEQVLTTHNLAALVSVLGLLEQQGSLSSDGARGGEGGAAAQLQPAQLLQPVQQQGSSDGGRGGAAAVESAQLLQPVQQQGSSDGGGGGAAAVASAQLLQPAEAARGAWDGFERLVSHACALAPADDGARGYTARRRMKLRLQAIKDAAYAWRNMVFFLSLLPADPQREEFLAWAEAQLQGQGEGQRRYRSHRSPAAAPVLARALAGLRQAHAAAPVTAEGKSGAPAVSAGPEAGVKGQLSPTGVEKQVLAFRHAWFAENAGLD